MLIVTDIPRVTCKRYKHFGIVGDQITIACEVKSNPVSEVVWQWGDPTNPAVFDPIEDGIETAEEVSTLTSQKNTGYYKIIYIFSTRAFFAFSYFTVVFIL